MSAGSVKAGGFGVTVAGRRYGKGSSREASPYAEWCAGIRLVIAESFERIYRQNCRNLGIYTSTDFGLIERIRRGESIPSATSREGEDELTAELIRRGGLFEAGPRAKGRMVAGQALPRIAADDLCRKGHRTRFCRQFRRFARGSNLREADWRYAHEYVTPMCISFLGREMGGDPITLHDRASIVCFGDHLPFIHLSMSPERRTRGLLEAAQALAKVQQQFCEAYGLRLHGYLADRDGSEGISHSIMTERYVRPVNWSSAPTPIRPIAAHWGHWPLVSVRPRWRTPG